MQTWLVANTFEKSATLLDRRRLGAQLYESVHILASLRHKNHLLINPKRDVSNHPASKLWVGYERELGAYIYAHLSEWCNRGYKSDINTKNYRVITEGLERGMYNIPSWITSEVIVTHRNVLYRKNPTFYPKKWCGDRGMRYDWQSI